MATRRMIASNIWEDDFVGSLSFFERLLWIGLFSRCADDQGRMCDNWRLIRSQVFPYDDLGPGEIVSALEHFEEEGKIIRYSVNGRDYIQLAKWWQNQNLAWAAASKHPGPSGWTDHVRLKEASGHTTEQEIEWPERDAGASQEATQQATQEASQEGGEYSIVKSSLVKSSIGRLSDLPDANDLAEPATPGADAPPPEPKPKRKTREDKPPTGDRIMFGTLQRVCNVLRVSEEFRGWANKTVKWLGDSGYSPGDLGNFGLWWVSDVWRKEHQPMTQVRFEQNFGAWVNMGKPLKVNGKGDGNANPEGRVKSSVPWAGREGFSNADFEAECAKRDRERVAAAGRVPDMLGSGGNSPPPESGRDV